MATNKYFPCFTNTNLNIVAVRTDWLERTKASAKRVIFTTSGFSVEEAEMEKPIKIDFVMLTSLNVNTEQKRHYELSQWFENNGVNVINPDCSSERADNKYVAYKLLLSKNILTPVTEIIQQNSSSLIIDNKVGLFLKNLNNFNKNVVILPNHGTEGRFVRRYLVSKNKNVKTTVKKIVSYIKTILVFDDVVLREECGNVKYLIQNQSIKSFRQTIFRINVSYNGTKLESDSGYAEIAGDDNSVVSSPLLGGSIMPLSEAVSNLYALQNLDGKKKVDITDNIISLIKQAAENSVNAINKDLNENQILKIAGVDIVLDYQNSRIVPIVLEINARPAGLSRAEQIDGIFTNNRTPLSIKNIFTWILNKINVSNV